MEVYLSRDEERDLVDRCLSCDDAAWYEFDDRYKPGLRAYVRERLRDHSIAGIEADDLVQIVWCSLVIPDMRRLAAFRTELATVAAYLNTLALQQIQQKARAGRTRTHRDVPLSAAEHRCEPREADWMQGLWLAEIQDHLSPEGLSLLQEQLGLHAVAEGTIPTQVASRQRKRRLLAVFEKVLERQTRERKQF